MQSRVSDESCRNNTANMYILTQPLSENVDHHMLCLKQKYLYSSIAIPAPPLFSVPVQLPSSAAPNNCMRCNSQQLTDSQQPFHPLSLPLQWNMEFYQISTLHIKISFSANLKLHRIKTFYRNCIHRDWGAGLS